MNEEIREDIQELAEEFKFTTRREPENISIEYIEFEDGRRYKFVHPSFLAVHKVLHEAESAHDTMLFALKCLHVAGDRTPPIDEAYMNANRHESFYLWSPLVRGLLSSS